MGSRTGALVKLYAPTRVLTGPLYCDAHSCVVNYEHFINYP